MRPKIASKIVNRVTSGQVTHSSYPMRKVQEAFRMKGVELTEEHLKPWADHKVEKARLDAEREANAPTLAARRKANEERLALRAKAADNQRALIRTKEAERLAKEAQHAAAAEAGREAFKNAMEKEENAEEVSSLLDMDTPAIDESLANGVPETEVEVKEPAARGKVASTYAYDALSVKDLKAECKARGLTNYSGLKRPELTAMLTETELC